MALASAMRASELPPQAEALALHTLQGPEEIDRGGATGGQTGFGLAQIPAGQRGQGVGVGGGNADGGRAPHYHGADGLGHRAPVMVSQPHLCDGQLSLIQ